MHLINTSFALWALFLSAGSFVFPIEVSAVQPGSVCLSMDDSDPRKWTCLAQVRDWQEQRVRVALDKVMMAASDEDAKAGANGYGLKVRLLDKEQMIWEQTMAKDCAPDTRTNPSKPSVTELTCQIGHLNARHDALRNQN